MVEFPVPACLQRLPKRVKGGSRSHTQPTIAHDETHEVEELICCPLWNCVKAQVFTTKGSFVRLLYKLILAHSYSSQLNLGLEF